MAQTKFASVFINSATKHEFAEEEEQTAYNCGSCKFSCESLYLLILHESQVHFIEFSRIVTKLKDLIDGFLTPNDKIDQKSHKIEDSPPYFDPEPMDDTHNDADSSEETEIIRRLQESGQVSFTIKKKLEDGELPHQRSLRKETPLNIHRTDRISFKSITGRRSRPEKRKNSFSCLICNITFDKFMLLQRHERTQHKFICHFCQREYTVKLNLKMHILREHLGRKTYCIECGLSSTNLAEHMKKHENDPSFVCDICGKEMRGKQKMNNHMNRSHKSAFARFFCKVCETGFKYMADLNEHMIKHEPDKKDHKCGICGKAYKRKNELRRHIQSHSGQRWPCDACGREYAWQRGLWTHKSKGCCKGISDEI